MPPFIEYIRSKVGPSVLSFKILSKNHVKIIPKLDSDSSKIVDAINSLGSKHYTFAENSDKTKRLIMRGLPVFDCNLISKDLKEQGFPVVKVYPLSTKRGRNSNNVYDYYPPNFVEFDKSTDLNKVRQIRCHSVRGPMGKVASQADYAML